MSYLNNFQVNMDNVSDVACIQFKREGFSFSQSLPQCCDFRDVKMLKKWLFNI